MTPLTPAGQALLTMTSDLYGAGTFEMSTSFLSERLAAIEAQAAAIEHERAVDACAVMVIAERKQAADRALAELRREVEAMEYPTPWWEPEAPLNSQPDGYFVDRAAILTLIDKQLGGRDAAPARGDRSNGERDAAGRSSTPVRLIDKAAKPEEGA